MIAIKDQWPESLKRRLAAAFVSNNLGIGMDYALKRYVRNADYTPDPKRLDTKAEYIINSALRRTADAYAFEKPGDADPRDFFFAMAFLKAGATLRAAHTMAQQGYLSETVTLCRMALETLAWAACASHIDNDDKILKTSSTKAISTANRIFKKFGRLYGLASKFTHWEPEVHLSFLGMGEMGSEIVTRSTPHKICALLFLLGCIQLSAVCFIDHMTRFYPERDLIGCPEIVEETRSIAIEIVKRTLHRTKFDALIHEISSIWIE